MMVFFCTWALAPVFVEVEFSQGAEANISVFLVFELICYLPVGSC